MTMEGDLICGTLVKFSTEFLYFPVIKDENWLSKDVEYFTVDQIALLYLLGIMFAVTAVGAFGSITLLIFQSITNIVKLQQVIILSLIFIFNGSKFIHFILVILLIIVNLVRSAYFFIYSSNPIQSSIVDYIMVVLPTFIYFTTFTLIVNVW